MEKTNEEENFDYATFRQQAIQRLLAGDQELTGKDGLLAPLLKDLLDAALSAEVQTHVEQNRPNRRNGSKAKQPGRWGGQNALRPSECRDAKGSGWFFRTKAHWQAPNHTR